MSQVTELLVRIKQQGGDQLPKLANSLKNLGQQTAATQVNFKDLAQELQRVQSQSIQSINNLKGYANAWREIANSVDITSAEFKQATAEAAKLEAQLKRTQGAGAGGGLARGARVAGAVAASGVFGGAEGMLGAGIGAVAGGPMGAAVGGAIGAQVGMLRQQLGGLATYTAEIEKQRIALKLVTQEVGGYQEGLAFVDQASRQFAIPQELITRQFTQLSASVIGAGGNIKDAEKAFIGIAAGIRGTGGSLQDMDAALRATAQVFSKGKVSAEELRQQIGERLPGAFTLFAKSIGMTPQELDKALEDGKVSLQDFQKFAEELFKRYGKSAEIIAQGPQSAGDRLQAALSRLSESVGRLLAPIGAAFQSIFADIVNAVDRGTRALARFFGMKFFDQTRVNELTGEIARLNKEMASSDARGRSYRQNLINIRQAELKGIQALQPKGPAGGATPSGLPGIIPGDGSGKASKEAEREAKKQERLLERRNDLTRKAAELERQLQFKIDETNTSLNRLGETAYQKFGNQYSQAAKEAQKQTDDLLVKVFALAKEISAAEGNLNEQPLVKAIIDLQDETIALAQGESAQGMQEWFRGLESGFTTITEKVYENARAMQYNADVMGGLKDGLQGYANGVGTIREAFAGLAENGIKGVENSIYELMTEGTTNYQAFATEIINQTIRMILQQYVLKTIMSSLGFLGGGPTSSLMPLQNVSSFSAGGVSFNPAAFGGGFSFANGGIMTGNGPLKLNRYAAGGVAYGPQLAMFGEGSRPEAYVPLPDGRSIPVRMQGSSDGGVSVVVNVDASGSSVEGNNNQANQLGKVVGAAVRQELILQKRPGGLLS
jgi:tape measure domain-containing protein